MDRLWTSQITLNYNIQKQIGGMENHFTYKCVIPKLFLQFYLGNLISFHS
jgi:hypothetical protein